MAAYAATVTLDFPNPKGLTPFLDIVTGTIDVTNYNTTLAEITGITKLFRTVFAVVVDGPTDAGYILEWNNTSSAFKAWQADYSTSVDGPLVQLASDTDAGACKFIALGIK